MDFQNKVSYSTHLLKGVKTHKLKRTIKLERRFAVFYLASVRSSEQEATKKMCREKWNEFISWLFIQDGFTARGVSEHVDL